MNITPEPNGWDDEAKRRVQPDLEKVLALMRDGHPWYLHELSDMVGCPEASASAHVRSLRKEKHGGWIIKRTYVGDGLHEYRLVGRNV